MKSKSAKSSKSSAAKDTDILRAMKDQHKILKESIKVIKSQKAEDEEKQQHLIKFIPFLKMHSEAEEQTIYGLMTERAKKDDDEQTVIEAEVEHKLAKSLIEELEGLNYQSEWNVEIAAKAKVLVEIVKHHADEEEDEFFDAIRDTLDRSERMEAGQQFLQKCEEVVEGRANSSMAAKKGKKSSKQDMANGAARQ